MWGAYFCMGAYKRDVVVVIKISANIHEGLFSMGAYYPDFTVLQPQKNTVSALWKRPSKNPFAHLQILIARSMQNRKEKAWGFLLCDLRHQHHMLSHFQWITMLWRRLVLHSVSATKTRQEPMEDNIKSRNISELDDIV